MSIATVNQYFRTTANNQQPPQAPSLFSYFNPLAYHPLQTTGNKIKEMFIENGPAVSSQLETVVSHALLKQPPHELFELKTLLEKLLPESKNPVKPQDLSRIEEILSEKIDRPILQQLSDALKDSSGQKMEIKDEGIDLILNFNDHLEEGIIAVEPEFENEETTYRVQPEFLQRIKDANAILEVLIANNRGALIKALAFLQDHLIGSGPNSLSSQALEILNKKLQGENGVLKAFEIRLTKEETGILAQAVKALTSSLDDRLNAVPHRHLAHAKTILFSLKEANKEGQDEKQLDALVEQAAQAIDILATKEIKIFRLSSLRDDERQALADFWNWSNNYIRLKSQDPSTPFPKAKMDNDLKNICKILERHFHTEEGLLRRTANTFVETMVHPVIDRIEQLPSKLINSVINPSSNEKPPETVKVPPPSLPQSSPGTQAISMGKYLKVAGDIFESLFRSAGEAMTKKLVEQFSCLLLWGLKSAEEYTENKEEYKQAYEAIKSLVPEVQKIVNPQTQQEMEDATGWNLITLFKKGFSIVNQHQIYLNGKRVPRIGGTEEIVTNSIGEHFNNLKKLDPPSSAPFRDCDYQKLIEIEQREFIRNTTHFATLKTIYESKFICGIKPKDAKFYYQLMDDALKADPQQPFKGVRIKLYEKIDEAYSKKEISFLTKLLAKASYPLLLPLFHYFIDRFSNHLISAIKGTTDLDFREIIDRSIGHFTGYLEVLGSVFDRVAERKTETRTLPKMIEEELQLPDCNRKRTPEQLYAEFTQKAVDRFAPRIKWSSNLSHWIENKKSNHSSFPKKTWNVGLDLAYGTLNVCILLPQMMLNKALLWSVKKALIKNQIVKSLVDNSSSSVMDKNGYSHALNCVIYEQLQKILDLMQIAYSKKRSHSETPLKDLDSIAKKEQFTALVKNIFEVLPKSKCSTRHELKQFLEKKSLSSSIKEAVDDFMVKDTVEAAIKLIKIAIDSVVEKDQINKRMLEFMSMANKSFKVGSNIPLEEFKAKETAITDQCDKIINLALDLTLEDRIDFSVDKLRNKSHQFIQDIKDGVKLFCESNTASVQELASIVDWDHFKSMDLLEQMKAHSKQFQQMRMNAMFTAKGTDLDSETKKKMDIISTTLAKQFSELDDALIQMHTSEIDNNTRQKIIQELRTFQQLFDNINSQTLFLTTSIATLQLCHADIQKMEQIIQNLPKIGRLQDALVPQLHELVITARNSLNELLNSRKTLDALIPELDLSLSSSLICQLKEQKKEEITDPFATHKVKPLIAQISEQIKKIPVQNKQEEFKNCLELIKQCKNLQDLDRHFAEFGLIFRACYDMEKHRIEFIRDNIRRTSEKGIHMIQTSGEIDPEAIKNNVQKIQGHLQNYLQKLQEISTSANGLDDISIMNIKILDENMVKDFGKEMGYHHVKKRIDGLVNFIRKPYNVSGFYRHGVIIPFLEKQF